MSSLFLTHGYRVYFWPNKAPPPIYVHVCKGKPTANAIKLWLSRDGGCLVANNNGKIPQPELNEPVDIISAQFDYICDYWNEFFQVDEISFFC